MAVKDNIERFAAEQGWVVKYAADGTPNFFYPIPKMKSSDLDPSLPDHTHPAFIVNNQEIDRRLIAVYKGGSFNGACHSIPNVPPLVNLGADQLLAKIKACGTGFGPKTVADSGLLLLLARKLGYTSVKGNNSYGVDYRDGTKWEANKSVSVGDKRVFQGVEYTALVAHTTALENKPDVTPLYWKRGRRVGGVPVPSQINASNPNGLNTLTGSGPASWRFGGMANGIDDLTGNCFDQDYGHRIYDGELQILANNNAADPNADLSASSAAWKAILPDSASDSYTLVAPGTEGTLHWTWQNSKITLDTVAPELDNQSRGANFKDLAVNATNVPHIPCILYELGLFPISGDTTQGYYYITFSAGERFPRRGGYCYYASYTGLGYVYSINTRSNSGAYYGVRGGFLETEN